MKSLGMKQSAPVDFFSQEIFCSAFHAKNLRRTRKVGQRYIKVITGSSAAVRFYFFDSHKTACESAYPQVCVVAPFSSQEWI